MIGTRLSSMRKISRI
jgi:hypothetical protein